MFTVLVVYLLVSGTTWRGAIRRSVMVDICGPCDGSDFDINLDLSNRIGTAGTFDASNLEEWQKVLTLTMEDAADTTTTLSGLNPTTGAFLFVRELVIPYDVRSMPLTRPGRSSV
jgi:hypothetical protein